MADVTERWFSDRLQQEITVMRWGSFGTPVLGFPSAGGDAGEIERHGLVDACGPLLAEGKVKLYSVDSVAGQAMVSKTGPVELPPVAAQPVPGVRALGGGAGDPRRPRRTGAWT